MTAALTSCPKISSIAGAAFQMQKELQCFKVLYFCLLLKPDPNSNYIIHGFYYFNICGLKGMEKLVHPLFKELLNKDGDTPWELSTSNIKICTKKQRNG